jgi:dTDP-4-amino-4,6-dideoxygalactose transaminase
MTTTTTQPATQPVQFLDLGPQHAALGEQLAKAVTKVIQSQHFVLGAEGKALEAEIAAYTGAKHAIGCASGSDALLLALRAFDIGATDCIVTTPWTFFATAGAPARLGTRVVFVDVEPGSMNLDPAKLEAFLATCRKDPMGVLREPIGNQRVAAVIAVDIFGRPARLDRLEAICKQHGLKLIDDAAQALGASLDGKKIGCFGDVTTLSFYPTKNLGGAGDGGMMTTNDDATAARLRSLRVHGGNEKVRYIHREVGWNSRLDELQAAVLRVKLPHLDGWNARRQVHARAYDAALKKVPGVRLFEPAGPGVVQIHHLYVIHAEKRDALKDHLTRAGIGAGVYYPVPLHLQECFQYLGYRKGDLPVAEKASDTVLALPMYPELPDAARDRVVDEIRRFYGA